MSREEIGIEFYTDIKALAAMPELHPKPMKAFTPSWWKDMPAHPEPDNRFAKTVKVCPSFPDYFSLGYVIPNIFRSLPSSNFKLPGSKSPIFQFSNISFRILN